MLPQPISETSEGQHAAIRALDVVGAIAGLVLSAPVILVAGLAIKLASPGPVFYKSYRIGSLGRPFTLLKLRSMTTDSAGSAITVASDSRITPVGQLLRKWKLDELPQFMNVLRGDMSLVGPRPESPVYVAKYSREQLTVLDAKPGMTSPASLEYKDESDQLTGEDWEHRYVGEIMPTKLAIDLAYLKRRNAWTDLRLIMSTIAAIAVKRD